MDVKWPVCDTGSITYGEPQEAVGKRNKGTITFMQGSGWSIIQSMVESVPHSVKCSGLSFGV